MRHCSLGWTFGVDTDSQGIAFGGVPSPPSMINIRCIAFKVREYQQPKLTSAKSLQWFLTSSGAFRQWSPMTFEI